MTSSIGTARISSARSAGARRQTSTWPFGAAITCPVTLVTGSTALVLALSANNSLGVLRTPEPSPEESNESMSSEEEEGEISDDEEIKIPDDPKTQKKATKLAEKSKDDLIKMILSLQVSKPKQAPPQQMIVPKQQPRDVDFDVDEVADLLNNAQIMGGVNVGNSSLDEEE